MFCGITLSRRTKAEDRGRTRVGLRACLGRQHSQLKVISRDIVWGDDAFWKVIGGDEPVLGSVAVGH